MAWKFLGGQAMHRAVMHTAEIWTRHAQVFFDAGYLDPGGTHVFYCLQTAINCHAGSLRMAYDLSVVLS